MKIEHAAIYVNDIEAEKEFFARYFGASAGEMYHNKNTGFRSYFLSFDGGARLELMTAPGLQNMDRPPLRTGFAHLAFSVGSRVEVDALTERLRADGYAVVSGPRVTGDGYYESCVLDAEGNRIEITE